MVQRISQEPTQTQQEMTEDQVEVRVRIAVRDFLQYSEEMETHHQHFPLKEMMAEMAVEMEMTEELVAVVVAQVPLDKMEV